MAQAIIRDLVRIGTLDDVGTAPRSLLQDVEPARCRRGGRLAGKRTNKAATFASGDS
jgi:hypothetical protein